MLHEDPRFADAVASTVAGIEARTSAEVIVVAARQSGAYNDVPWRVALGANFAVLALLVWLPVDFNPDWFLFDCGIGAALAAWLGGRVPLVQRAVAGGARMREQVREAAEAAFAHENVHGTRARTGVLVYLSGLEREVLVLPDHGLLGRVPHARLHGVRIGAGSLDEFLDGLRALGEVLAEHVPAVPTDNPNESPDAPRVRD
jgi:putative membrane protein